MLIISPKQESNRAGYLNISMRDGEFKVGDTPILPYLLSENLITPEEYGLATKQKFSIRINPVRLKESSYEFSGKVIQTIELFGEVEIKGSIYGVNLKAGKDSVAGSYLLTGLLMVDNSLNQPLAITVSGEKKAKGIITKVWVNSADSETVVSTKFEDIKPLSQDEKLSLLSQKYPGKVFLDEELEVEETVEEIPF